MGGGARRKRLDDVRPLTRAGAVAPEDQLGAEHRLDAEPSHRARDNPRHQAPNMRETQSTPRPKRRRGTGTDAGTRAAESRYRLWLLLTLTRDECLGRGVYPDTENAKRPTPMTKSVSTSLNAPHCKKYENKHSQHANAVGKKYGECNTVHFSN